MSNNNIQGNLLFMYTETSLHAGTGSTVSVIDLPIQRERTTNFPNIQGSGVKGALRAHLETSGADSNKILTTFGNVAGEGNKDKIHAGSATFGEARVVLFPVRSLMGVFAHVTCPFVLGRLARDMEYAGLDAIPVPKEPIPEDSCLVSEKTSVNTGSSVVLEEYAFTPNSIAYVDELAAWLANNAFPSDDAYAYWRERLAGHLVVLSDDAFRDFVSNSTEITTHINIDNEKKTVKTGALWTKESLPADTLMVSTVVARPSRMPDNNDSAQNIMSFMTENLSRVQIAGDETTGNGVVALKWFNQ